MSIYFITTCVVGVRLITLFAQNANKSGRMKPLNYNYHYITKLSSDWDVSISELRSPQ